MHSKLTLRLPSNSVQQARSSKLDVEQRVIAVRLAVSGTGCAELI